MNKDRKAMYVSILALIIAVVGVSIAYAALSTSLKVTFGKVTRSAFVWEVKLSKGEVPGTASGTNTTTCGTATVSESSVTVDAVTLSKPGDKCSYPITVQNKGDIDANITNIAATSPSGIPCDNTVEGKLSCGNVTYKLTSDIEGLNVLKKGTQRVLKNNGTADFYLVVSYDVSANALNQEVTHTGAGFTVVYGQAN
ncbi:MAG: hypothetical protein HFE81_06130 [Bacilli bacterium]|nr:hypothetical protein [Bacilli bacterium]